MLLHGTQVANLKSLMIQEILPSAAQLKKVVCMDAGPSSMEVTRVARLPKHGVTLMEKEEEVGSQNLIAGNAAGRQEITGVTRWLVSQLNQLELNICIYVHLKASLLMSCSQKRYRHDRKV